MKKYLSHNGNLIQRGSNKFIYRNYIPDIQPYTLRLRFREGVTPSFSKGNGVLIDSVNNIWDLTYENTDWTSLLANKSSLLEVIDGNATGVKNMYNIFYYCSRLTYVSLFNTSTVTNMECMFQDCYSLISVPLFDTSNVTTMDRMFDSCISLEEVHGFNTSKVRNMSKMFYGCTKLTYIPMIDTSKVTNMNQMLYNCKKIQSGALALYQQASTQTNPPSNHTNTFHNCGIDTQTGAAELAQIPTSWGGTMQE